MENSGLLVNIVYALGMALLGAIIATRLRQPLILGYILGGIAIGPHTPGFVGDPVAVEALADVGIILLMFTIGVRLSLRDLLRVGRLSVVGGLAQVLAVIGLGYLVGTALGWRPLEALFFGAVISNSSSTVISKVMAQRGDSDSTHGRIALAWSSVQDFSTIGLVVVLTSLAAGGHGMVADLFLAVGRAALYIAIVVPFGIYVLPWVFARIAAMHNREVFILSVSAIALGTAYVSTFFGLSLALGAFVAGIVVAESDISYHILGEVTPLRDVFAGIFFVSIGMLVDPTFVLRHPWLVLMVLALIIAAKGAIVTIFTALAGLPVRVALLTGAVLAQSAEFSFIMARVGADLGVVSPTVFTLMLTGAAASIVLAPYVYRGSTVAGRWADRYAAFQELSQVPASPAARNLEGHAVICGYGRVGHVIGNALQQRGFPFVLIDQDQREVRRHREEGMIAMLGNAENFTILERAGLAKARILVVAIPDGLAARQIIDYARSVNPDLPVVVRTHDKEEQEYMYRRGASEAVMGEVELALEMARYTLTVFDVPPTEAEATIRDWREADKEQARSRPGESSAGHRATAAGEPLG